MDKKIIERLAIIETKLSLLEKVIIGAATLGFIEKLIAWFIKGG